MNKKRTNYFVTIINIIATIALYIFYFSLGFLCKSIISGPEEIKSIYNSAIIEFLIEKATLIVTFVCGLIGILNIICAIQNRKNKKILFWQLIFGL